MQAANLNHQRRTGARVPSPSSGVRPGARALNLELPTSFGLRLSARVLGLLAGSFLFGNIFLSHSAYATFSASISRSGTVSLAEPGSSTIRPTSAGTLGTGSDTVTITTNCTYGGYKLYVSATSSGGTALKLSDNSDSIPTSSNLVGSESTLSRDTWGVGKTASAFSGLQAYSEDVGKLTPFYAGVTSDSYTFYYGVNVSTAKTPGTYTGEVLYTVLMDEACTKYTLNFDGNNATTNTLTPQDLDFDATINLADISSTSKIARTGYTLTGWKDQNGNSYGVTGEVDINPSDLSSVTLTAEWKANTYTIAYNGNGSTGGSTASQSITYDGGNVTLRANGFSRTGYTFQGWSRNSGASNTVHYNGNTAYAINTIVSNAGVTGTNNATITLYAVWKSSCNPATDMQCFTCSSSGLATNGIKTLTDKRDGNAYAVKKLADGKCWMVQNLRLVGPRTLTSSDSDVFSNFVLTSSITTSDSWCSNDTTDCRDKSLLYYDSSKASSKNDTSYYGALYNWYTATAGTSVSSLSTGKATSSICPRGWRLPVGGKDDSNEFSILDKAWGGNGKTGSEKSTYSIFTGSYTSGNNGGFGLAGHALNYDVGTQGDYWSSTASASSDSYADAMALRAHYGYGYPYVSFEAIYSYRSFGFSVRCIASS